MPLPAVAAEAGAHGFMGTFTKKLGPLPVYAWAAILLGAVLAYMYWKKVGIFGATSNSAGSAATPTAGGNPATSTDTTGAAGIGSNGIVGDMGGAPTGTGPGSTSGAAGSDPIAAATQAFNLAWTAVSGPGGETGYNAYGLPLGTTPTTGNAMGTPAGNGVISTAGAMGVPTPGQRGGGRHLPAGFGTPGYGG